LRRSLAFRASLATWVFLASSLPGLAQPRNAALPSQTTNSAANIVIGFVGGFVDHDNPHHGPVQLARRIRQTVPPGTYVQVFENRHRKQAYNAVLHLLDTNRDGALSAEEKSSARIILFGHSWGAAAAVLLARDLGERGIPVLLTVQVDSVAKWWQNDAVIPDNVGAAVNFYQTAGILHGRRQITAIDPAKTEILGNYRIDYKKTPVECPEASWWERVLTPGHMQSECDPTLWSQIENLVTQRLAPQPASVAVSPSDHAQSSP
jgi:pimeloyl-ACP methyl ester carboxylesterase